MSDQLLAVIVGGVLTVLGGFVGAAYLQWRDERRRDKETRYELIAASRIARHEVTQNWAFLKNMIQASIPPTALTESNFRSVQLILARHLPKEVRDSVLKAYTFVQPANHIINGMHSMPTLSEADSKSLQFFRDCAWDASQRLGHFLKDTLKVEL